MPPSNGMQFAVFQIEAATGRVDDSASPLNEHQFIAADLNGNGR